MLKTTRADLLLFTNQGYRKHQFYLPVADYDLSESLMTSYAWGEVVPVFLEGEGLVTRRETFYRPWEQLRSIVTAIEEDVQRTTRP